MIDLTRLAEFEKQKAAALSPAELFRWFCLKLVHARYKLGSENILETDCSGTICWPLFCLGVNLRLTAAGLYESVFTHASGLGEWKDQVLAIFYRDPALKVSHVSPIVGRGVILDAVDPALPVCLKDAETSMEWYTGQGYHIYIRAIDWNAAHEVAEDPANAWAREADDMLKALA